jgi:hypothetical protein
MNENFHYRFNNDLQIEGNFAGPGHCTVLNQDIDIEVIVPAIHFYNKVIVKCHKLCRNSERSDPLNSGCKTFR